MCVFVCFSVCVAITDGMENCVYLRLCVFEPAQKEDEGTKLVLQPGFRFLGHIMSMTYLLYLCIQKSISFICIYFIYQHYLSLKQLEYISSYICIYIWINPRWDLFHLLSCSIDTMYNKFLVFFCS